MTHTFGWKPYSRKGPETTSTARDNPLGAMMGGGCWHNWHHTYAWLQGERHCLVVSTISSSECCSPDQCKRRMYLRERYCWDYADAELGALQQWNPTKVFIDTMALVPWHIPDVD